MITATVFILNVSGKQNNHTVQIKNYANNN